MLAGRRCTVLEGACAPSCARVDLWAICMLHRKGLTMTHCMRRGVALGGHARHAQPLPNSRPPHADEPAGIEPALCLQSWGTRSAAPTSPIDFHSNQDSSLDQGRSLPHRDSLVMRSGWQSISYRTNRWSHGDGRQGRHASHGPLSNPSSCSRAHGYSIRAPTALDDIRDFRVIKKIVDHHYNP